MLIGMIEPLTALERVSVHFCQTTTVLMKGVSSKLRTVTTLVNPRLLALPQASSEKPQCRWLEPTLAHLRTKRSNRSPTFKVRTLSKSMTTKSVLTFKDNGCPRPILRSKTLQVPKQDLHKPICSTTLTPSQSVRVRNLLTHSQMKASTSLVAVLT